MTDSVQALIAVGGNSRAARSLRARLQWRDRYGRWIEMGRGIKFKVRLRNGSAVSVNGHFVGAIDSTVGQVYVKNDPNGLKDGFYKVKSGNAQEILASLDTDYLKNRNIELGKDASGNPVGSRLDADVPDQDSMEVTAVPEGWIVTKKDANGNPTSFSTNDGAYGFDLDSTGYPMAWKKDNPTWVKVDDWVEALELIGGEEEGEREWPSIESDGSVVNAPTKYTGRSRADIQAELEAKQARFNDPKLLGTPAQDRLADQISALEEELAAAPEDSESSAPSADDPLVDAVAREGFVIPTGKKTNDTSPEGIAALVESEKDYLSEDGGKRIVIDDEAGTAEIYTSSPTLNEAKAKAGGIGAPEIVDMSSGETIANEKNVGAPRGEENLSGTKQSEGNDSGADAPVDNGDDAIAGNQPDADRDGGDPEPAGDAGTDGGDSEQDSDGGEQPAGGDSESAGDGEFDRTGVKVRVSDIRPGDLTGTNEEVVATRRDGKHTLVQLRKRDGSLKVSRWNSGTQMTVWRKPLETSKPKAELPENAPEPETVDTPTPETPEKKDAPKPEKTGVDRAVEDPENADDVSLDEAIARLSEQYSVTPDEIETTLESLHDERARRAGEREDTPEVETYPTKELRDDIADYESREFLTPAEKDHLADMKDELARRFPERASEDPTSVGLFDDEEGSDIPEAPAAEKAAPKRPKASLIGSQEEYDAARDNLVDQHVAASDPDAKKRLLDMIDALDEGGETGEGTFVTRDENGNIAGVMRLRVDQRNKRLAVSAIYTSGEGSGHGTALMSSAARIAKRSNSSLHVAGAVQSAKPFYARMGASQIPEADWKKSNKDSDGFISWSTEDRDALASGKPVDRRGDFPWMTEEGDIVPSVEEIQESAEEIVPEWEASGRPAAEVYDKLVHDPDDPEVQASYDTLAASVVDQYRQMKAEGIEIVMSKDDPYENSKDMIADLDNGRLAAYADSGETLPEGHPMNRFVDIDGERLHLNDVFRAVHDYFGHAKSRDRGAIVGFGPKGEWEAWRTHRLSLPEESWMALWTETRGQNTWTNYANNHSEMDIADRPFAEQKVGKVDRDVYAADLTGLETEVPKSEPANFVDTEADTTGIPDVDATGMSFPEDEAGLRRRREFLARSLDRLDPENPRYGQAEEALNQIEERLEAFKPAETDKKPIYRSSREEFLATRRENKDLILTDQGEPVSDGAVVELESPEKRDPDAPGFADDEFPVTFNTPESDEEIEDRIDSEKLAALPTGAESTDVPDFPYKDSDEDYADEPYMPTQEQRNVIQSVLSGFTTVVQALAGSGKTSTLVQIAKQLEKKFPNRKGVYVVFNKKNQIEGEARMPKNFEVLTMDALAYRSVDKSITKKLNNKNALRHRKDIAREFGISELDVEYPDGSKETLEAGDVARDINKAIDAWVVSSDPEITARHFEGLKTPFNAETKAYAEAFWTDLQSPDGNLPLSHSHITKMWALGEPDLRTGLGLKRKPDIIFVDEAQDLNPVFSKVLRDQEIQKVVVGDSRQSIYGFRGAADEMDTIDADATLPLTQSWRFGPEIAGMGNRFLSFLGSDLKIVGGGEHGEVLPGGSMDDPDAILTRSNFGALTAIIDELEKGRIVGTDKNFKREMTDFVGSVSALRSGGTVTHPDLAQYSSWDELEKDVSAGTADYRVEMLANIVESLGLDRLREAVSGIVVTDGGDEGDVVMDKVDFRDGANGHLFTAFGVQVFPRNGRPFKKDVSMDYSIRDNGDGTFTMTIDNPDDKFAGYNVKDMLKAAGVANRKIDGEWVKQITGTEEQIQNVLDRMGQSQSVDVVVSTAHKSKGLEWDRVKIGDDFRGPVLDPNTDEMVFPDPEEIRLAYVAVTRAQKALDPGSLEWIMDHTSDEDEDPNTDSRREDGSAPEIEPVVNPAPEQEDEIAPEDTDVPETPEPVEEPTPAPAPTPEPAAPEADVDEEPEGDGLPETEDELLDLAGKLERERANARPTRQRVLDRELDRIYDKIDTLGGDSDDETNEPSSEPVDVVDDIPEAEESVDESSDSAPETQPEGESVAVDRVKVGDVIATGDGGFIRVTKIENNADDRGRFVEITGVTTNANGRELTSRDGLEAGESLHHIDSGTKITRVRKSRASDAAERDTDNRRDIAKIVAAGKDLSDEERSEIEEALDEAETSEDVQDVLDRLNGAPNRPNTSTERRPKAKDWDEKINTRVNRERVDPRYVSTASEIWSEVNENFPEARTLSDSEISLASREDEHGRYDLILRRTQGEEVFAYIRQTYPDGSVRVYRGLRRAGGKNHSMKAIRTQIDRGLAMMNKKSSLNKQLNYKKSGIEKYSSPDMIPDRSPNAYIPGTLIVRGKDRFNKVATEVVEALTANPQISKQMLRDFVAGKGFHPDLVDDIVNAIARRRAVEHLDELNTRETVTHASYDGTILEPGMTVDWTDTDRTIPLRDEDGNKVYDENGKLVVIPNPNYGRVYRGEIRHLAPRIEAPKYEYTDNVYAVFPGLDAAEQNYRSRVSTGLKVVNDTDPLSAPFFRETQVEERAERGGFDIPESGIDTLPRPSGPSAWEATKPTIDKSSGKPTVNGTPVPLTKAAVGLQLEDSKAVHKSASEILPGDMLQILENGNPVVLTVTNVVDGENGTTKITVTKADANGNLQTATKSFPAKGVFRVWTPDNEPMDATEAIRDLKNTKQVPEALDNQIEKVLNDSGSAPKDLEDVIDVVDSLKSKSGEKSASFSKMVEDLREAAMADPQVAESVDWKSMSADLEGRVDAVDAIYGDVDSGNTTAGRTVLREQRSLESLYASNGIDESGVRFLDGGGSSAYVKHATINGDGRSVVVKGTRTEDRADSEILFSTVSKALGVPGAVTTAQGESDIEIVSDFVPGRDLWNVPFSEMADYDAALVGREARLFMLADYLTDMRDRHTGNIRITEDGQMVAIDNEMGFGLSTYSESAYGLRIYDLVSGSPNNSWFTQEELRAIREDILTIQPAFAERNREDWFSDVLSRLDDLIIGAIDAGI